MNFRQFVKTVDTSNYYEDEVELSKIKAQYNPERFHLWKSLHKGPEMEALNMLYSPHYRFLKDRSDKAYHRLQRLYGRNDRWIKAKIEKFLGVLESIRKNGFTEKLVLVEKPLIENKYNKGFEIFEGHHRDACALILGMKTVPCQIVRRK